MPRSRLTKGRMRTGQICEIVYYNVLLCLDYFYKMLRRLLLKPPSLTFRPSYQLLEHKKMDDLKAILFGKQEKTFYLKIKFILKQTKYTLLQGTRDLWRDTSWILNLYRSKSKSAFTGFQLAESRRVSVDLVKFMPYSLILVIPFAEVLLPVQLYLFPNAVPSFFLFDTAEDQRIEGLENLQQQSHHFLLDRLLENLRDFSSNEEAFTHYDSFKRDFFEVIDRLNERLDFHNFTSDELIHVLQFLGAPFITGTTTVNKISNLFTLIIPRLLIKFGSYLKNKRSNQKPSPYTDPTWVRGNFRVFRFNYFPFEILKKRLLIFQINRHFQMLKKQDEAFEKFGMADLKGVSTKSFARQRGFPGLTCYDTLQNVLKNDWVKITTHPKFESNNIKIWYSVMMYKFLGETNTRLN